MFDEMMTNKLFAAFILSIANGANWASQHFDLILARATAIASFILIIVMIRKHFKDTKEK